MANKYPQPRVHFVKKPRIRKVTKEEILFWMMVPTQTKLELLEVYRRFVVKYCLEKGKAN